MNKITEDVGDFGIRELARAVDDRYVASSLTA